MLLFYGNTGVAIKEPEVDWCRRELSNVEIVDLGDAIHFVRETHPNTIGTELARWYGKL